MKTIPAAVGVADHNGWAFLLTVAAPDNRLRILDRRRAGLVEPGFPSNPYHHDTLKMASKEAEALVARTRRAVSERAAAALRDLVADMPEALSIKVLTIRHPPLPALPDTVAEVHASWHVTCRADGMMYHDALCRAAADLGWDVLNHDRGKEVSLAAETLDVDPARIDCFLKEAGQGLGTPWQKEHRAAAAAAIAALQARAGKRRLSFPSASRGSAYSGPT